MTQVSNEPLRSYLGGESGHRSFFGGQVSKQRLWAVGLSIGIGLLLTLFWKFPGLVILVVATTASFVLTTKTHRGSILERRRKRRRWKSRVQAGTHVFRPYTQDAWDAATEAAQAASSRRQKWTTARELAALRTMPDAADGMGWLQKRSRRPGIAWHSPAGEAPYLSVVWSVSGMVRGIETNHTTNAGTMRFSRLLAQHAQPGSLIRNVQSVTRIVPADTALHEFWVRSQVDPDVPAEAKESYEEVLALTSQDAMIQRHYVIASWPLGDDFYNTAAKYGPGRDGWRSLMADEIASFTRELRACQLGDVSVLTARQVSAVLIHMQNPGHPIDYVAGVDPASFGVASRDEFSATVTDGTDIDGAPVEYWHRTARISAGNLSTGSRTPYWAIPLLVGTHLKMTRTLSFHHHLVSKIEAKAAATKDLVRDDARAMSDRESGRLADDATAVAANAAAQRLADFRPGTGHEGDYWVGYLTVTETSREQLARSCRDAENVCNSKAGIERLEWLDSYQAAASGTTWPIGRGIRTVPPSASARFYRKLAGRSTKDELT